MKTIKTSSFKAATLTKTGSRKASLKSAAKLSAKTAQGSINDLLPHLQIEKREVAQLKDSVTRVRKPSKTVVNALVSTIATNGFLVPVLVRGDVIVDGHSRVTAARQLQVPYVPVLDISHLTPAQSELVKVAVNRTAELGEWDLEVLRHTVIEIEAAGFDLDSTGFTLPELDCIKLDPAGELDQDLNKVPDDDVVVISMLGDVWQLGDHRLLCGSAIEVESYAALLGHEKVAMVLTDPPYNVKIAGNVSGLGKKKHGEFVEATGEMSNEEFRSWLTTMCQRVRAVMQPATAAMMFMDWRHIAALTDAGEASGFTLVNMVVWDKQRGGMGGLYRSAHELVAVFCSDGPTLTINNVKLGAKGRDRTNIWSYPGATTPGSSAAKALADHPTPKPVELLVDAMLDVTNHSDTVLDPFMGSGSTIIAGEECGRQVRGIELDPKYVDSAVRRWEAITGGSAVLISTGQTFADVRAERLAAN